MTNAIDHQADASVDEDVTQELAAPEFIDAPENLPGDHSDPTSDRTRGPADQLDSERSV